METRILDENFEIRTLPLDPAGFGYKKSPFQDRAVLILAARFALKKRVPREIREEMDFFRRDREAKGHYRYPSAGSVFKNYRDFGAPTGKIIDELGLRGFRVGGAQVAPWHGNIIINTGGASAGDICALIDFVRERARTERGIELEPEILFAGSWESPRNREAGRGEH
jgi:UDP-N-acetylmuramate dehydrogenase